MAFDRQQYYTEGLCYLLRLKTRSSLVHNLGAHLPEITLREFQSLARTQKDLFYCDRISDFSISEQAMVYIAPHIGTANGYFGSKR
jgi:hypothetical protein